jgi:hypothetical protein
MRIVHNPKSLYPYEVWFGRDLVETFVVEDTAKVMLDLQEQMRKLYVRNEYEKSKISK